MTRSEIISTILLNNSQLSEIKNMKKSSIKMIKATQRSIEQLTLASNVFNQKSSSVHHNPINQSLKTSKEGKPALGGERMYSHSRKASKSKRDIKSSLNLGYTVFHDVYLYSTVVA